MTSLTIKDLPETERPRERFLQLGSEALSSAELLAILIGSGTRGKTALQLSQELLTVFGSLRKISESTPVELCRCRGLGLTKALKIKAALSLAARLETPTFNQKKAITAELAYQLIKEAFKGAKKEMLLVLLQDAKGCAIHWEVVSVGTLTKTLVHPREIFYPAIRYQAASIILAHNHPSGDLTPSEADYQMTKHLITVGKMMGFPIHDHLIISETGYLSLRQKGLDFS